MKEREAVVKIDSELLGRIDGFISKNENKLRYTNKKQFVNIAVFELLEKEKQYKSKITDKNNKIKIKKGKNGYK